LGLRAVSLWALGVAQWLLGVGTGSQDCATGIRASDGGIRRRRSMVRDDRLGAGGRLVSAGLARAVFSVVSVEPHLRAQREYHAREKHQHLQQQRHADQLRQPGCAAGGNGSAEGSVCFGAVGSAVGGKRSCRPCSTRPIAQIDTGRARPEQPRGAAGGITSAGSSDPARSIRDTHPAGPPSGAKPGGRS
jgi:hypothetical protein